jgi:predicted flap endonuclease-1-like 5' DNA nuclease
MHQSSFPQLDTERAVNLTMGAASPLWPMFFGAAATGAAIYWMTSWSRAANLEAYFSLPAKAADLAADASVVAAEIVVEAAETVTQAVIEPIAEVAPEIAVALVPEPVAPPLEPDDLTQMVGIGAKMAAALAERGVTRFEHIAAWTDDDIAAAEKDLKLMGRVKRENWIAQARRLAKA